MAGIAVSGLASGFDWQTTVQQLIAVERQAQVPLNNQKTTLARQLNGLDRIKANLEALQNAANTLKRGTSDYYSRSVTAARDTGSTNSNLSATATGTTPLGSYTFNIIQKATATQLTGSKVGAALTDATKTLANLNIAGTITAGNFTVNGKTVTIATTDTLQSVFDKISTATSGEVTAALSGDKVVLTGNNIGNGQPRIVLGSAADTSNFLDIMKLYTDTSVTPAATVQSSTTLGSVNINTALVNSLDTGSLTGLSSGAGSFTVNGKTINYNINTSSIRSILNDINTSGAGVLANYDTATGKIVLTNTATGSTGIALDDSTGIVSQLKLTAGAGATTSYGVNARFTINGGSTELTSTSNTLTEQITGIPGLQVTIKDTGSDTLTVKADTSAAKNNIRALIDAYNKLNTEVRAQTKTTVSADGKSVTTSPLSSNREVTSWLTDIRNKLYATVNTGTSGVSSIYQVGLDFSKEDGSLSIKDTAALDKALDENPEALAKIFNNPTTGIGNVIYDYVAGITATSGSYTAQKNSINERTKTLDNQLERMERKVLNTQATLTANFQAMEAAIANTQRQSQILNGFLR